MLVLQGSSWPLGGNDQLLLKSRYTNESYFFYSLSKNENTYITCQLNRFYNTIMCDIHIIMWNIIWRLVFTVYALEHVISWVSILNYISRIFTNFKNCKKLNFTFTIKSYLQYVNNLKMGKRQLSITKEKANQKSKPKIMSTNVDRLQREWSLLRPHVIWKDVESL